MKESTSPTPRNPSASDEFKVPKNGSEIKYVRTHSYPSTSRNSVDLEHIETVSNQISDKENLSHIKREGGGLVMGRKSSVRDRSLKRQTSSAASEKKTRWLLTRKTWRYMADAGRKLIPEGTQTKPENIEKIEEHFQKLCQNEKKFLIWKRKLSYPGASGSFRRKNKNKQSKRPLTLGSPPGSSADECEDDRRGKGTDDLIIKMLEKYLNINSDIEESENEHQRNTLPLEREINAKTTGDFNSSKASTSVQKSDKGMLGRSGRGKKDVNDTKTSVDASALNAIPVGATKKAVATSRPRADFGTRISSSAHSKSSHNESPSHTLSYGASNSGASDVTKSRVQDQSIWHPVPENENIHSQLLLDTLQQYRKKTYSPYLENDKISTDLLNDKILLRKILNDIRTQQKYSKSIPRTESTRSLNISHSSSLSSLTSTISSTFHNFVDFIDTKTSGYRSTTRRAGDESGNRTEYRRNLSGIDLMPSPSYSIASSSSSRAFDSSSSSLSKPSQIYSQQKQIFANQQQQQLYHHQQHYPSLRSTRTISTTLKTITKTTSTTTFASPKQSTDLNSPSSPTFPSGILKNVSHKPVKTFSDGGTQTDGIPFNTLSNLFTEYKKEIEIERQEEEDSQVDDRGSRKTSIDNKDVSQSVSDTIKRYLMMARKKPKDNDAANRFKRVNYDRNLRNIKAKGETTKPGDDDGLMKGCQTDRDWLEVLFGNSDALNRCNNSPIFAPYIATHDEFKPFSVPQSVSSSLISSPSLPSTGIIQSGTQFLSNLFYHNQSSSPTPSNSSTTVVNSGAMQKSKSSSNVRSSLMSKKIFRSRSKSQTRTQTNLTLSPTSSDVKPQWTPQGNGVWVANDGKRVQLRDVFLPSLTEVERLVLQKQAQEKILQLGVTISPQETYQKPHKRRVLLLKRKAVTTGLFDSKVKNDYSKGGLVFNLPLEQCIENDHSRTKEKKETRSSRSSLSSLHDYQHRDNSGSCESLPANANAEYLHNTFVPLLNANIDRRSSNDYDDLQASNIPGVHIHLQQVPSIVIACTKFLEENGLNTVGIFRVSTSKKRVRQLREDFEKGGITTIDPDVCPHDVATLLKEFFRDLPEPLLCRHLYKSFLQTQSIRNRRLQLEGISHMIQLLPEAHRDTLYVLLKFLGKVARTANDTKTFDGQVLSSGNKMDSINLATIIAPNILHCIKSDQFEEQEMTERADVINIIRIMIDHFEDLFIVRSEDMNEIYTTMMDVYPLQLDYLLDRLFSRQEEDIDSGSSIPPLSPPYNQHHHATFSDEEKAYSPTSSSATTAISTIEMPKRVVYSREDILHENAGKGGNQSARRLNHHLKYQDIEKPMRRRKQSDRTESGDLSSSSSTHESYQHSSGISVGGDRDYYVHTISSNDPNKTRSSSIDSNASDVFETNASRRMSSPLTAPSHGAGVVTASLKIPVQTSAPVTGISSTSSIHSQNIKFYLHEEPSHKFANHIIDIPFIEDSPDLGLSDEIIRKNAQTTVFPQRPQSVTVTTKRLDEVQIVNNPPQRDDVKHLSKTTKEPTPSTSSKIQLKKLQAEARKPSITKIQMSSSADHIALNAPPGTALKVAKESNYTPSISSIGSVLLRSKTADFERILSDQNKKSRMTTASVNPPALKSSQNNQSTSSNAPSMKVSSQKKNISGDSEKRMPIYKRQELISSVQKVVKK